MEGRTNLHLNSMRLPVSAKIKVEKDNCLRLQCEVKTNDHWVSFLGYHFNFSYWLDSSLGKREGNSNFSIFSILKGY